MLQQQLRQAAAGDAGATDESPAAAAAAAAAAAGASLLLPDKSRGANGCHIIIKTTKYINKIINLTLNPKNNARKYYCSSP